MNRVKIYLDTSIISHLKAEDTPEKMQDTLFFWEDLKLGKYQVIISNITLDELARCPEPKRSILLDYLNDIKFKEIKENNEMEDLANMYITYGVLKPKSLDDCRHIAIATLTNCKYIVSWNFKHFVNVNIINKVQGVNKMLGFDQIQIVPPSMMIEGDDEE